MHPKPKSVTHPCDHGSSGAAQWCHQEGQQHHPDVHDRNSSKVAADSVSTFKCYVWHCGTSPPVPKSGCNTCGSQNWSESEQSLTLYLPVTPTLLSVIPSLLMSEALYTLSAFLLWRFIILSIQSTEAGCNVFPSKAKCSFWDWGFNWKIFLIHFYKKKILQNICFYYNIPWGPF